MKELTQERLKELLHYEPDTGVFTWLVYRSFRAVAGSVAGRTNMTTGYIEIQIDGRRYKGHRLAWLYMTGEQASGHIDHVNEVKVDNRIGNLRVATRAENKRNVGITKANTSGAKGVYKQGNRWIAQAQMDGKKYRLGSFMCVDDAAKAYDSFCQQSYGEFYHHGSARSFDNQSQ
ncbi:HNH endonuclease [Yersinia massiliensis]|uniref:Fis family transcriptional regulator n=1 Tax=Yersinia massiliensis TaxID=419257 RepID=A0ABM6UUW9_9GAMM|nr:HNH endonuclease [Yersinia massiliensis]AVX38533.1 Fis family transcriptional regulator [Yersinia massiliensis]